MRVLIPVFFNAPLGGLHFHVRAQSLALLKSGNDVIVLCKPGPFSEILECDGATVLHTDFSDLPASFGTALHAGPYDLVHAHPFASRRVGLNVSAKLDIPLIVTFHNTYQDYLPTWHEFAHAIITVSPAIRDYLCRITHLHKHKVMVLPNGVDLSVFNPVKKLAQRGLDLPAYLHDDESKRPKVILFASRFDSDKSQVLEVVLDAWRSCTEQRAFTLDWWVVGEGSERLLLERAAEILNQTAGREVVTFFGWQRETHLADLYTKADIFVGPGRCVLESMASGTPAIAVGHSGYLGLVNGQRFAEGYHINFGGQGLPTANYSNGQLFDDITRVIHDRHFLRELGDISVTAIQSYFNQDQLDKQLLALYELILHGARQAHT